MSRYAGLYGISQSGWYEIWINGSYIRTRQYTTEQVNLIREVARIRQWDWVAVPTSQRDYLDG